MVNFIDSPCFAGQQIDRRTLHTEAIVLKTDAAGTLQFVIPMRLDYVPQWKAWAQLFEEYRIASVTAELIPYQGSAVKGMTVFWWDTGVNPDPPTATQAIARTSGIVRNASAAVRNTTFTYTYKETEDLNFIETNTGLNFGTTQFSAYSDTALFDSPPDAYLFLLRFRYTIVFKTLRVLE